MEINNLKSSLRVVKNTLDKQGNSEKVLINKLEEIESDMKNMLDKIVDEASKDYKIN